jgi:hypothetical protein
VNQRGKKGEKERGVVGFIGEGWRGDGVRVQNGRGNRRLGLIPCRRGSLARGG